MTQAREAQMSTIDREKLARTYMPLVRKVAAQVAAGLPSHVSRDDLVGWGTVGLVKAINKYESARSGSFKSYVEFRVRGEMIDSLRRNDLMARDARVGQKRLAKDVRALEQRLGRPATDEEVAAELELDLGAYRDLQRRVCDARLVYCDTAHVPDERRNPHNECTDRDARRRLAAALEQLPTRKQTIVDLFYYQGRTLNEIGTMLGVSASRVCQIRAEVVQSLREQLHTRELPVAA